MLPFALDYDLRKDTGTGDQLMHRHAVLCCGCGYPFGLAIVAGEGCQVLFDDARRLTVLHPGYRPNRSGVFVHKRPARARRHVGRDGELSTLEITNDVTVICHRCNTRQIVRGG